MHRFARLFREIEQAPADAHRQTALDRYLAEAPPEDGAWAQWFYAGNRLGLRIPSRRLLQWAAQLAGMPEWLAVEAGRHVGDLAEAAALLLPLREEAGTPLPLHVVVEQKLLPLRHWDASFQFQMLRDFWLSLNRDQAVVVNRMLTRGFPPIPAPQADLPAAGGSADPAHRALLVLVYAQAGRQGRQPLQLTLAAREGDRLVAVARVEPGPAQGESAELEAWIQAHTLARRGPVSTVPARQVFEITFTGLRASARHKSGLQLLAPRIRQWRRDLALADVTELERLREMAGP